VILSIDPGSRCCGFALFDHDHSLYWAGLIKNKSKGTNFDGTAFGMVGHVVEEVRKVALPFGEVIDTVVIERPQVYVASKLKGDPNDLIGLAVVVGGVAMMFSLDGAKIYTYLPREWAGQVPKEVRWGRAQAYLRPDEKKRIQWPAKSLAHNVQDAIGIGLKHIGRGR
jgi:hypothetical protein